MGPPAALFFGAAGATFRSSQVCSALRRLWRLGLPPAAALLQIASPFGLTAVAASPPHTTAKDQFGPLHSFVHRTLFMQHPSTYHTEKEPILVREFGRNMQAMILHAKAIEDAEERQAAIEHIVKLIINMYPDPQRSTEDYRIKIWSHILQICNYELAVDIPEEVPRKKEKIKPDTIPYPENNLRYRQYGRGIPQMIEKAIAMEDEEKKADFTRIIAAFMKQAYNKFNQGHATNELIADELHRLSKGELSISPKVYLDFLKPKYRRNNYYNKNNNYQKKRQYNNHR